MNAAAAGATHSLGRTELAPTTPLVDPVSYRGGHLQIIACAGAGKTETIARRVASLLADGVEPAGIIAFTFTDKAGSELKSRVEKKVREHPALGPSMLDRLGPMFVGTMHAYCMQMLQAHVPAFAAYDVLDPHKLIGLLSREYNTLKIQDCFRGWGPDNIEIFHRSIDVVENELIDPNNLPAGPFRTSYLLFIDLLQRYRALTYGQMVVSAVDALRTVPEMRDAVLAPLRHVIVDEYQDTNPAQEALIWELCDGGAGAHVTVVGDDDQAIYQWRGATVQNILTFDQRYPGVAKSELAANRRSQPHIIGIARDFVSAKVEQRLEKSIEFFREPQGGEVVVWEAETPADEAEQIAKTILRLKDKGFAWGDMAVLLRSVKVSSRDIILALEEHGIPVKSSGSSGLFVESDAQLFAQLYSWLADRPWKEDRWSGEYEVIERAALLAGFAASFELDPQHLEALAAFIDQLYSAAHDDQVEANLIRDYYALLRRLGVHGWDLSVGGTAVARMGTFARFSTLLADYEHATKRARIMTDDGKPRGGMRGGQALYQRLYNYMQYYALTSYEGFTGEDSLVYDAVDVTTVHTAKGLQWPIVFVPALSNKRFPSSKTGRAREYLVPDNLFDKARYLGSLEDEARLFYVAMTRARDALYISRFRRMKNRQGPSSFFEFAQRELGLAEDALPLADVPDDRGHADDDLPLVTFSDLAAYDSCPQSYRFRSLIGFQPPLARELGYGKAVHHVLRRIADETQLTGQVPMADEVAEIVESEFFLPFANRPAHEQMLGAAQQLVSKFVADHRDDLERVWETERPFELHLDTAIVAGRADVILDREDGVPDAMAIVDYKTGVDGDEPAAVHEQQLRIYTSAGRKEGIDVRAAYLMDLKAGATHSVRVGVADTGSAEDWAASTVARLQAAKYPASPEKKKCSHCDVAAICAHG